MDSIVEYGPNLDFSSLPLAVRGMPNDLYHGRKPFDGRSFLCAVAEHGGEAQLWMDMGRSMWPGSTAMTTGSEFDALITGIIEGKNFDSLVVVPPDDVLGANGSRSTKAYKEWAAKQTGVCLTEEKKFQFQTMYDGMMGNDSVHRLISETTKTQLSVFFQAFDHFLKVRPDACTDSCWWDLKTTSARWHELPRSVMKYGYAEQAWLYTQGAMALGYGEFKFPFVFVQTVPPYRCRVYSLPDELVERAGQRLVSVMEEVRLRRSTGVYVPEDAGEIQEMVIPAWAFKQEEVVEL